jgi:hypothetical protein
MAGFNPVSALSMAARIAPFAAGPAGIASFAATQLTSRIGQQAIQMLGNMVGMPQASIDLAQGAFAASHGDFNGAARNMSEAVSGFGEMFNASRADQDQATQQLEDALNKMVSNMADGDDAKAARAGGKGGKGGQSWLMALAEALGKKLDKMARDMSSMADQITDKTPSLTAKFGAKSQEFGILMNAATNAIKTIGEAEANSARKG